MFGFARYNYDQFQRQQLVKNFARTKFGHAPNPGSSAPDFELRSLDGEKIRLSDFKHEKNVVLTFGSATCPQTAASISQLRELEENFHDEGVQFLFVYTREAHPGNRIPAHQSREDKVHAAEIFRDEEHIEFPILVDDLSGRTHRRYGSLPNPTFIIDTSGRVAFRSLASNTDRIEEALNELLETQQNRGVEHAVVAGGEDASMPAVRMFMHAHRALSRGGQRSIRNFQNELGMPARMAVTGGRLARPIADHPGTTAATALAVAGVLGLGLWIGRELRRRRFDQTPYRMHTVPRHGRQAGWDDYEAVGI
ncbi:MAG TPA: deiodinase-like protein [Candidatus Acidoferrales bacterium]|nr:deiodinase-like protein [Candidatus Acidoferrales bacterium]